MQSCLDDCLGLLNHIGKRHISAYFRGYVGDYILFSPESGLLFLVDENGVERLDCSSKYHQKKCRKLAYSSDKRRSLTQLGAIIISSVRLVLGLCGLMLKRTSPWLSFLYILARSFCIIPMSTFSNSASDATHWRHKPVASWHFVSMASCSIIGLKPI